MIINLTEISNNKIGVIWYERTIVRGYFF